MIIILGILWYTSYSKVSTVTATVCNKESVSISNGHEYRVYTSKGTYVVKDHIINGARFNSADVYGRLRNNVTYVFKIYGLRVPLFSSFKNIQSETKAAPAQQQPNACNT